MKAKSEKDGPVPSRKTQINHHLKVLVAIAVFWLVLLIIVLVEHARSWARLLPVIGLVLVLYAVYATVKVIQTK